MSDFTVAQQTAIDCLDENMAVAAGAGAGKTRVLVERYINILLKTDALCDEILAITFTNKAATEMKQRIRSEVAVRLGHCNASEQNKWQDIRYRLEFAPIGTIHSLCARILRENPVEAGLDPDFIVADEAENQLLQQTVIENIISRAAQEEADWLLKLLAVYGRRGLTNELVEVYEKLAPELEDQDALTRLLQPYIAAAENGRAIAKKLLADCQELIDFSAELDKKSAQYQAVMALSANWNVFKAAVHDYMEQQTGMDVLEFYLDRLKARNKDKEIVKSIRKDLEDLQGLNHERQAIELIKNIWQYFTILRKELRRYKQQRQILSFDDLEMMTLNLLRKKGVCRQYCERFRYIMVDEVQDINDWQRQIIYLLCGGDKDRLLEHKLFIVGDAKQSIYRFRGADVDTFAKVTEDIMRGGGRKVELTVNFRSTDKLLAAVNDIFRPLMGTECDKVRFSPLEAHRTALNHECVEFILLDQQKLPEGQDKTAAEAGMVARKIKQMVEEQSLTVDGEPVTFGQIAVLFRSTTDMESYEAALQSAAIPYYIWGGRGFYQKQEILDVLNLLRVIDNCHNEPALAGVLRSPLFLLSDETLYWLKERGGSLWQGLHCVPSIHEVDAEQRTVIARTCTILDQLRAMRGYVKVSQLLSFAVDETQYDSFLVTQFMGLQKFANVQKLIAMAQDYEQKQFCTIHDFLSYIENLTAVDAREGEAKIESETGNTVKLMTIHKAKGLEFPVVFLPDLGRKFLRETGAVLYDRELGLGVKVRDEQDLWQKTAQYSKIAAKENLLETLELKRVLYVAMTRAKDHLVLSAVGDKVSANEFDEQHSWLDWFGKICGFAAVSDIAAELTAGSTVMAVYKPPLGQETAVTRTWYQQYRQNSVAIDAMTKNKILHNTNVFRNQQPDTITVFSPTALHKFRECPRAFFYQYIYGLPELAEYEAGDGDSAKAPPALTGIAAHKACELVDRGVSFLESLAMAIQEIPDNWQDKVQTEIRPLLENYFSSDFYQQIKNNKALSEQKIRFTLTDDKEDVKFDFHGIIDRINFYDDGTLGIVDYKTDTVSPDKVTEKQEEYLWQLLLYKIGAQRIFKKTVRDMTLYFLRAGIPLKVLQTPADEKKLTARICETCRYISHHRQMADYGCNITGCSYCAYQLFCEKKT